MIGGSARSLNKSDKEPMKFHEHPPTGPLALGIEAIWTLAMSAPIDAAADPIAPDGRSEIILHLGDPYEREDGPIRSLQSRALVAGQIDQPLYLRPTGNSAVVGFRIRPGCARAFLDVPQSEILNLTLDPHSLSAPLARTMQDVASRAASPEDAARALGTGLLSLMRPERVDVRVRYAARMLEHAEPPSRVTRIAHELGISTRHLERLFLDHVGLTPKVYQRIRRLRRALDILDSAEHSTLAHIAARAGYSDHSHFVRDCRAFSGCTPSQLAESEHPLTTALLRGVESHSPTDRKQP